MCQGVDKRPPLPYFAKCIERDGATPININQPLQYQIASLKELGMYLFTFVTIKVEFAPKEAKKVVLSLNGMEMVSKNIVQCTVSAYFSYYFNITET